LRTFLAIIITLGGLAVGESLTHSSVSVNADFLLLLVLACIAAPHTLHFGHNARISTLQPFMLAAIVFFGVQQAMLMAGVAMTYFWIVSRPRLEVHKALFNLCNFLLAAWLGGHVFSASGGHVGDLTSPASLLGLLLTALTFFAVNTGLVSIAIGLEQKIAPFQVWYEKYSWTLSAQLAGASIVILLSMLRQNFGIHVFFLLAPFCVMSYHFYRAYFPRSANGSHRT
jgi:hypothetical protein